MRGKITCKIDAETQNSTRIKASRQIIKFLWFLINFADFSLPLLVIFVPDKNEVVSTVILQFSVAFTLPSKLSQPPKIKNSTQHNVKRATKTSSDASDKCVTQLSARRQQILQFCTHNFRRSTALRFKAATTRSNDPREIRGNLYENNTRNIHFDELKFQRLAIFRAARSKVNWKLFFLDLFFYIRFFFFSCCLFRVCFFCVSFFSSDLDLVETVGALGREKTCVELLRGECVGCGRS